MGLLFAASSSCGNYSVSTALDRPIKRQTLLVGFRNWRPHVARMTLGETLLIESIDWEWRKVCIGFD